MLFSTFFAVITLPILYIFEHAIFDIPLTHIGILVASGCLGAFAIYIYLVCLFDEETSIVAPFFQLIPVFGFIFGFYLLGEGAGSNISFTMPFCSNKYSRNS
jgi:drug/metabolite transporter (DMT)-like permease